MKAAGTSPASFTKRDILRAYNHHPLQEKTILRRVCGEKGSLNGICEKDLATDPITEITDQNHIGGVDFVLGLARRSRITASSKVLDLGCGLGGSARILAEMFGCRVEGFDLSPKRHREARRLTRRVGLEKLVTFRCVDFLSVRIPTKKFDVIWGQSAWVHVRDKRKFIQRWGRCLKSGGRVAMEDAVIIAPPKKGWQSKLLLDLEGVWNSCLVPAATWQEIFAAESFHVCVNEDHTNDMRKYFRKLLNICGHMSRSSSEATSWQNALLLAEAGVLGYVRIVAEKAF